MGLSFPFSGSHTPQDGYVCDGYQDNKQSNQQIIRDLYFVSDIRQDYKPRKTGEKNS
jgi:hypothetical protein